MDDAAYKAKVEELKDAIREYMAQNGRRYGDMTRIEQSVEDLLQATYFKLDLLLTGLESPTPGVQTPPPDPRTQLAERLMRTAAQLTRTGRVDAQMVDEFDQALDAFDLAADLRRQSETARDAGESAALRRKRNLV